VANDRSWAVLTRLTHWLDPFKACFGHRAQAISLRPYVEGLLSDSARKSMQAMLTRLTAPVPYQAFQHFITHAPWDAAVVWRRLLSGLPERQGVLVLDDTGFPKQGRHSVGVARQYSGTLGKIGNCQVAVTAALWTGVRAWLVGAELYLPRDWLTPERRAEAGLVGTLRFQEKWRLALTLLRRARAAGLRLDAVLADSAYGDVTAFRTAVERMQLRYAVGISSHLTVFPGRPRVVASSPSPRGGRPRKRPRLHPKDRPLSVSALAKKLPRRAWRCVSWRNGKNRPWEAEFAAMRVTPAHEWRRGRIAEEVWLLCQRPVGAKAARKFYFSNLPPRARLSQLVRLAHQRWAVEQQYQNLKTELGLDHFQGRSYRGWKHHVVLCAVAYAFLQKERMRPRPGRTLTFPAAHAVVQEVFTGLLFLKHPRYFAWLKKGERFLQLRM